MAPAFPPRPFTSLRSHWRGNSPPQLRRTRSVAEHFFFVLINYLRIFGRLHLSFLFFISLRTNGFGLGPRNAGEEAVQDTQGHHGERATPWSDHRGSGGRHSRDQRRESRQIQCHHPLVHYIHIYTLYMRRISCACMHGFTYVQLYVNIFVYNVITTNMIVFSRHGVRQRRTAWADGPEFVTQCPIRPGGSYKYRFTIEGQVGTLWWHAHSSWLRATVYGALIIHPKGNSSYPFTNPQREFPILLGMFISSFLKNYSKTVLIITNASAK